MRYCEFEDKEIVDNTNGQSQSENNSECISEHGAGDQTDGAEWNVFTNDAD